MSDCTWIRQGVNFACNGEKRAANLRKHGLDLYDASAAFFDPFLVTNADTEHSENEERANLIAKMPEGRLIHVTYTIRGEIVRLISARKATKAEGKLYEQQD
jgi:uncharacterized DUF497 family protein